ncbi:amidohydrolase family protein [Roseivirga sp.]|uniref:amidohydrolase family protein n=1 Tax=Roseivirga sp. TaxID=1964215 RepID=UPI003B52D5D9
MLKRTVKIALKVIGGLLLLIILVVSLVLYFTARYDSIDQTFGNHYSQALLKNAHVIDLENDTIYSNQYLSIEHGLITEISSFPPPDIDTTEAIDMEGQYLIHGLADMHTHVFDPADLMLNLSYGVTHVRNMMGFSYHLDWRQQVEDHKISGSYMTTASHTFNGPGDAPPLHIKVDGEEEVKAAIDEAIADGYDFIKVYDNLRKETFLALAEYTRSKGIGFAGHPSYYIKNESLFTAGFQSIEHVEELFQAMLNYEFDSLAAQELVRELKEREIPVTITMSAYNHLYRTMTEGESFLNTIPMEQITPAIQFLGKKSLEEWKAPQQSSYDWTMKKYAFMEYLVELLDQEDVPLLLGTDTGPNLTVHGWSVHREIELLQGMGMSNKKILKSATVNAAPILNKGNFSGSIRAGAYANFLVVDQNPLTNPETMEMPMEIYLGSTHYSRGDLLNMRQYAIDNFYPWYFSAGQLINSVLFK